MTEPLGGQQGDGATGRPAPSEGSGQADPDLSPEKLAELEGLEKVTDDQQRGDAELVARLREQNYSGPDWEVTRRWLVEDTLPRLQQWIETGAVFVICRRRRLKVGPRPPAGQHYRLREEAVGFAWQSVQQAIDAFPGVLRRKPWSPKKGRSFREYFATQSLIQFIGIYRPWRRMMWPPRWSFFDVDMLIEREQPRASGPEGNPEATAVSNVETARLIKSLTDDPTNQEVLAGLANDKSQRQISKEMHKKPKAVEGRVQRLRLRARKGGRA